MSNRESDSAKPSAGTPQLRTESPYGDTPDEDVACAECGKYSVLVGPLNFDGEPTEGGDFICVPCALRRDADLDGVDHGQ